MEREIEGVWERRRQEQRIGEKLRQSKGKKSEDRVQEKEVKREREKRKERGQL